MWRKTRQPVSSSPCIGADPNRNYDSHWMENNGASSNPCAETYAGTHAFSEPEIKALANYVASIKERLNILLAFHSYSQVLLSPYGWTKTLPKNYEHLMAVAKAYSDAVEKLPYKTKYTYGTSSDAMCNCATVRPNNFQYILLKFLNSFFKDFASGATNDWAYSEQNILLSYTIEFRDTGRFGFILPPIQILPHCEDTLVGLLALVDKADELGYLKIKYA